MHKEDKKRDLRSKLKITCCLFNSFSVIVSRSKHKSLSSISGVFTKYICQKLKFMHNLHFHFHSFSLFSFLLAPRCPPPTQSPSLLFFWTTLGCLNLCIFFHHINSYKWGKSALLVEFKTTEASVHNLMLRKRLASMIK